RTTTAQKLEALGAGGKGGGGAGNENLTGGEGGPGSDNGVTAGSNGANGATGDVNGGALGGKAAGPNSGTGKGGFAGDNGGSTDVHNALSVDAAHLGNNFSPQPLRTGAPTGPFLYFKAKQPAAIGATGSLVGDVQAAKDAWVGIKGTMESLGYHFVYDQLYSPTQTDFTSDIVRMRSAGVKTLVLVSADAKGIARIAQQAKQQN